MRKRFDADVVSTMRLPAGHGAQVADSSRFENRNGVKSDTVRLCLHRMCQYICSML